MKRILIILTALILASFTLPRGNDEEVIIRLEVLRVTIEADVESNKIDSAYAASYLHNVNKCLNIMKNEANKTAKLGK